MTKENRSEIVRFRATFEEKKRILDLAHQSGLEVSDYMRRLATLGFVLETSFKQVKEILEWEKRPLPTTKRGKISVSREESPPKISSELKPPDTKASA